MALENTCEKTTGSIINLYLIEAKNVLRLPVKNSEGRFMENIPLKPGTSIIFIKFREGSCRLSTKQDFSGHGTLFTDTIRFNVNRKTFDKHNWINQNRYKKFIACAKDALGSWVLLGNPRFGSFIKSGSDTGADFPDRNEMEFELVFKSKVASSFFYTNAVPFLTNETGEILTEENNNILTI